MTNTESRAGFVRVIWTVVSLVLMETLVCGVSVLPVVVLWLPLIASPAESLPIRIVAISLAVIPSYVLFALILMFASAGATRLTGWNTRPNVEMRIRDLEWPLLDWVRYMVNIHIVRLFAGTLFRGTPLWSTYLRLSGGRIGRRVYVNSLALSDHNLLNLGDDVVIGGDVHLSGHTVEGGVVKTGAVRLDRNVTIGLGSVIGIGVEIGPDAQVGAMSLVPKHTTLDGGRIYVGVPAAPIHRAQTTVV